LASSNFDGFVSMAMIRDGLGLARALHDREADAAEAEHRDRIARLHLGGVVHRADAGGNAAAEQADLFGLRFGMNLRQRDFGDHGVFAEGAAAHVVVQRLAVVRKARSPVRHHALALGRAHGDAQVGLAGFAEQALAAFGGVQRDHVVAGHDAGHAFADLDHDARAFMPEHDRKQAFRIVAAEREGIGMADAGVGDLDQHLALARRRDIDLDDLQRLPGFKGDGGT
jgi:hypothetical protein